MKTIDRNLIEELYIKYINKDRNNRIYASGVDVRKEYLKITGNEITRSQYDNVVVKFDKNKLYEQSRGNLTVRKEQYYGVDKTKPEGNYYSKKYIEWDVEVKHTPNDIMLAHGFDPLHWKAKLGRSTGSKIGTKANDEQYFINTYKSIDVVPKQPEDYTLEDIEFMLKNIKLPKLPPLEYKIVDSEKAWKVSFNDIHVNSDGYCRDKILRKIATMKRYIENNDISKVYLSFEGDFLHVAGSNKQTVKGTQLSLVGDVYDMVDEGELLVRYIVEELAIVETELYWVLGNHSDVLEYMLFSKIKQYYRDSKHIKFFIDKSPYKAFNYGNQFIMISHGDIAIKEIPNLPSQRFPTLWSKSKYWEVHLGHIHHENVRMFGTLKVRYQGTPKETDEWEYYKGWYNDLTKIQGYTIDKKEGISDLHYY